MARRTVTEEVVECDGCGRRMEEGDNNWGDANAVVRAKPFDNNALSMDARVYVNGDHRKDAADVCTLCFCNMLREAIVSTGEEP